MTPRLSSSKKWTPIPPEFAAQIQTVFTQQFTQHVKSRSSKSPELAADKPLEGEFLIEGRIYPEEVVLRIGYLEKGRLKQVNFEASMDLPLMTSTQASSSGTDDQEEAKASIMDHLYVCIDAIGSLMEEYFQLGEDEEMDVPYLWRPYEFEEHTVYLQQSNVNTRLEEEADRLLGLVESALVHEEAASEDALAKAEIDTELAQEVQKAIRDGRIKLTDLGLEPNHEHGPAMDREAEPPVH